MIFCYYSKEIKNSLGFYECNDFNEKFMKASIVNRQRGIQCIKHDA